MRSITEHVTKCVIAGVVAILPIGGLVITVAYLESMISSSGISKLPFYFPGLGLVATVLAVYLIGLTVSTFLGRWAWNRIDKLINKLPALGKLYSTLKQILGYGEGEDAIFNGTVLVPAREAGCKELGLVTNEVTLPDGSRTLVVFVPGAPNPTTGRLLFVQPEDVEAVSMPVNQALKALVAVGKSQIELTAVRAS
jgi:uncharacterized membrane protein